MDSNCPICKLSKIQRAPHLQSSKRADRYERKPIEAFGELTADHAIMGQGEAIRAGDIVCLMVLDRYTGWLGAYPAKTTSSDEVVAAFSSFIGTGNPRIKRVYTDGSKEFEKALRDMHLPQDVSLSLIHI